MIVCSIVADFSGGGAAEAGLGGFLEFLRKKGSILISDEIIYFSSDSDSVSFSSVKKALKRNGIDQSIVTEYDRTHLPKEQENVVYGWLLDHIIQNATVQFDRQNQAALIKASNEIDKLRSNIKEMSTALEAQNASANVATSGKNDSNGGVINGGKQD